MNRHFLAINGNCNYSKSLYIAWIFYWHSFKPRTRFICFHTLWLAKPNIFNSFECVYLLYTPKRYLALILFKSVWLTYSI